MAIGSWELHAGLHVGVPLSPDHLVANQDRGGRALMNQAWLGQIWWAGCRRSAPATNPDQLKQSILSVRTINFLIASASSRTKPLATDHSRTSIASNLH
jgi:hypothetical protein